MAAAGPAPRSGSKQTRHPVRPYFLARARWFRAPFGVCDHANYRRAPLVRVGRRYDDREFRLRVRDDGRGFDPATAANQGREGHYGLPGMRERATIVGGKLTVWSEVGAGTEVELQIPASAAYAKTSSRWFSALKARR